MLRCLLCCSLISLLSLSTAAFGITCSDACNGTCSSGPCLCIANPINFGLWQFDGNTSPSTAAFTVSAGSSTPTADSRFTNEPTGMDSRMLVCVVDGVVGRDYYATITAPNGNLTEAPPTNTGAVVTVPSLGFTSHASGDTATSSTCTYTNNYNCSWTITGTAMITSGLSGIDSELQSNNAVTFERSVDVNLYEEDVPPS